MSQTYCRPRAKYSRANHSCKKLYKLRSTIDNLRNSRDRLLDEINSARALADLRSEQVVETNHRLKNSIQTAMSILNLQADVYADKDGCGPIASALIDVSKRLSYIARAHEMLYEHGVGKQSIDMDVYLSDICTAFAAAHADRPVRLATTVEPLVLDVRRAVTVALIVVEAVTNAYKHAFPDGRRGSIQVDLRRLDDHVQLTIADDGIGFAAAGHEQAIGMKILRGFSRNLGAEPVIESAAGTRITIIFPWG